MLRISYTLINLWEKGNKDEMVNYYLGAKKEPTKAMQKGKDYDTELTEYIAKNKALPSSLGGKVLTNPINQKYFEVEDKENDIKFVFVPDLIDEPVLYEFKTGTTEINQYLSAMQVPVYFYLLDVAGIKVDRAYLINEKQGWYIIRNTEETRLKAKEWLYENAFAIRNYFEEIGL